MEEDIEDKRKEEEEKKLIELVSVFKHLLTVKIGIDTKCRHGSDFFKETV